MSFNFMAAVTVCSYFKAQENKICHWFHFFTFYLLWRNGIRCHDLSFLNVEFRARVFTLIFHPHEQHHLTLSQIFPHLTSFILVFEPFLSGGEFLLPGSGCAENWSCFVLFLCFLFVCLFLLKANRGSECGYWGAKASPSANAPFVIITGSSDEKTILLVPVRLGSFCNQGVSGNFGC